MKSQDLFYAVLGHLVGTESGSLVPVIEGLPHTVNEDQLKAFGAAAAYLAFNGFKTSTINWQTFSQIAFAFTVTPALLVGGVTWAVFIGLIGGLFPAIRAARLPIAAALREL